MRVIAIVLAFLLLVLWAALADDVQARLRPVQIERREPAELPREWVWKRHAVRFDDMYRSEGRPGYKPRR